MDMKWDVTHIQLFLASSMSAPKIRRLWNVVNSRNDKSVPNSGQMHHGSWRYGSMMNMLWNFVINRNDKAIMEMASISIHSDVYPWRQAGESINMTSDINLFYWANPIPRPRWELESYREMNSFCYPGSCRPSGARLWCYVCRKGHPQNPKCAKTRLVKCTFCIDVYMCYEHRIFMACMGPRSTQAMCCRHSRFTPGLGSWNPEGGYPVLEESSVLSFYEYWEDPDVEPWGNSAD
eukprot:6405827-Amphidinium_carterae.3